jgi:hypothetical protein
MPEETPPHWPARSRLRSRLDNHLPDSSDPHALSLPSSYTMASPAIVNGKNPPQLTAKKLMRLTPQIPVDWAEQRKLLGFQQR